MKFQSLKDGGKTQAVNLADWKLVDQLNSMPLTYALTELNNQPVPDARENTRAQ